MDKWKGVPCQGEKKGDNRSGISKKKGKTVTGSWGSTSMCAQGKETKHGEDIGGKKKGPENIASPFSKRKQVTRMRERQKTGGGKGGGVERSCGY